MKKTTFTCFLALLCLFGSETYSQVASPPATEGPENAPAPVVVYGEIKGYQSIDSLRIIIWEEFFNRHIHIPQEEHHMVPLETGNFVEGAHGAQVFEFRIDDPAAYQWISVRDKSIKLIDRFLVRARDRVRIRFDRLTGQTFFGGPAAPYYEVQQLVRNSLEQSDFNQAPIMVTNNKERTLSHAPMDSLYRLAEKRESDIHLVMDFFTPGEAMLQYVEDLLQSPLSAHPAFEIINLYEGKVEQEFLDILRGEVMGRLLERPVSFLSDAYRDDALSKDLLEKVSEIIDGISLSPESQAKAPLLVKTQMEFAKLKAKAEGSGLLAQLDQAPAPLCDRLYAYYVFEYIKQMENPDPVLRRGLEIIGTPWIREKFSELLALHSQGAPLLPITVLDKQGHEVKLEQFRDKTVFLYFWIDGCKFCKDFYQHSLKEVMAHYEDDPEVVFLTVNGDRKMDRWLGSVDSGIFCDPEGNNFYANRPSPVFEDYKITSFPYKMLLSPGYRIYRQALSGNDPDKLIEAIEEAKMSGKEKAFSE
ncbi:hypothetical protein GCM10028791_40880 [Echinicola sediminis]